jgi:hypothetical protein
MSASTSTARNPHFGIEIEIFVKVKPHVKADVLEKRKKNNKSSGSKDKKKDSELKPYWEEWDFDLENKRAGDFHAEKKIVQRKRVALAIKSRIKRALGKDHGWDCVYDQSLKEWQLEGPEPPEPRKWCKSGCDSIALDRDVDAEL